MIDDKAFAAMAMAGISSWPEILPPEAMSLNRLWLLYFNCMQLEKCLPVQQTEMRKAFVAGFTECFKIIADYSEVLDDRKALEFMTRIHDECDKEVQSMIAEWKRTGHP